ncbi:hypothetical protein J3R83DRAFT_10157 [Lanmaoa asiatica]|nr:hypothetical protein J3R83DRAFT_10157 [Lanmaoa asiatica]
MSSTRSRNKCCLSLDNSSRNTISNTAYLNRWSEVVPPKTALTFAALWDPDEGMVTFSGAALLESESLSGMPPHIFDDDDDSQCIFVDRDAEGCTTAGENTATLATFQDAFKAFLHCTPSESKEHLHTKAGHGASRYLQTRASSTFDGLDVYSHDIHLKTKRSLQLSCTDLLDMASSFRIPSEFGRLRLGSDSMLDSYPSDSESDSSSESRPTYLRSRFSTTTTSTSNYVDVTDSALQSVHISETSIVPEWTRPNECASPAGSWPYLPRPRRLLRKRRPWDGDTTPTGTSSMPSTPRKVMPKPWMFSSPSSLSPSSPSSPSPSSPYPSATAFSSSASACGEERRSRFARIIGRPITPAPTPPTTPSKSSRLKLRFPLLPRRKPRQTSPDSDGWVCIEVTPVIKQRYVANLGED